jgi:hypothetical protein
LESKILFVDWPGLGHVLSSEPLAEREEIGRWTHNEVLGLWSPPLKLYGLTIKVDKKDQSLRLALV